MRNESEGGLKFKFSDHKKLFVGSPSKALFGHLNLIFNETRAAAFK